MLDGAVGSRLVPNVRASPLPTFLIPQMIAAAFPVPPSGEEGAAALPALPVVDAAGGAAFGGTWEGILPPGNVGQLLKALGQLAVGRTVERFWAEEGAYGSLGAVGQQPSGCVHARIFRLRSLRKSAVSSPPHIVLAHAAAPGSSPGAAPSPPAGGWWRALVSDFNGESGEHQLTYNAGQDDESYEWADLGELANEELRWAWRQLLGMPQAWTAACELPRQVQARSHASLAALTCRDATASAAMPRMEDLPPLPLPLEGWQPPADAGEAGAAEGSGAAGPASAAEPVLPVVGGAADAAAGASPPLGGFMGLLADSQPDGAGAAQAQQQQQQHAPGAAGSEQLPLAQGNEQDAQATLTVEELQAMLPAPPPLPPEVKAEEAVAATPAEEQQAAKVEEP